MDKIPHYEIDLDQFDENTGMFLVSFVDRPAMQVAAIKLAEEQPVMLTAVNEYKKYLTSAVIIPNKRIKRGTEETGIYTISFSEAKIEVIRNKFMRSTGNLRLSNKNHDAAAVVDAQLIETWIVDKANGKGDANMNLPDGTLMATYQILDEDFWNKEIKNGELGFSLEGIFNLTPVALSDAAEPELYTVLDQLLTELGL